MAAVEGGLEMVNSVSPLHPRLRLPGMVPGSGPSVRPDRLTALVLPLAGGGSSARKPSASSQGTAAVLLSENTVKPYNIHLLQVSAMISKN